MPDKKRIPPLGLITASETLFINYNDRALTKDCIDNGVICLRYRQDFHSLCMQPNPDWDAVEAVFESSGSSPSSITNQVRLFYKSGNDVLWIMFFEDRVWWCFAKQEFVGGPTERKYRQVIGRWKIFDTRYGNPLLLSKIKPNLASVEDSMLSQHIISPIKEQEHDYLLARINGKRYRAAK